MDMLDPFIEIVLDGIRAKKEEAGLDAVSETGRRQRFGQLLQTNDLLKRNA